jgi:hypothetical protein
MMITQKSRRRSFNIFDHSISLQLSKTIYFSFISFEKMHLLSKNEENDEISGGVLSGARAEILSLTR